MSTHNICLWRNKNNYPKALPLTSVAQLDAPSNWIPGGSRFNPAEVSNILS